MVAKDKKRIMITLSQTIYEQLEKKATEEERSIANLAAYIIINYFKNQK